MTEYETHDLEFDNSDLGHHVSGDYKLPPPRAIESLGELVSRVEAKNNYPKEEMRRMWVRKSAEREKAMKQLRDANSKLEYWISKREFAVGVIQECEACLQKLDMAIMSDITTR